MRHAKEMRMPTEVKRTITINRPRMEVYNYWRELKNLPNFMEHLVSVRGNEDGITHWVAKAPVGTVEWTAELVLDRPGEVISWRSVAHADVTNAGEVQFRDADGSKGTEVEVHLSYDPPAGKLGTIVAKLFGEEPDQQIRDDLERFKQIMEGGQAGIPEKLSREEIASLEGDAAVGGNVSA
jgi:uncharacterized membrane protein